jgi:hypothetical protein
MKTQLLFLGLFLFITSAQARPLFLVLDSDIPDQHPEKYGFIVTKKVDGIFTEFTIDLKPTADAAFEKASILILGDLKKDEIPVLTVQEDKKPRKILIRLLTERLQEYGLRVESAPIADTDSFRPDFAGFTLLFK